MTAKMDTAGQKKQDDGGSESEDEFVDAYGGITPDR
jgi:hypothetical protein